MLDEMSTFWNKKQIFVEFPSRKFVIQPDTSLFFLSPSGFDFSNP